MNPVAYLEAFDILHALADLDCRALVSEDALILSAPEGAKVPPALWRRVYGHVSELRELLIERGVPVLPDEVVMEEFTRRVMEDQAKAP